nr:uncharacterized protein LOC122272862 [Parasteatoda tepidariorum]
MPKIKKRIHSKVYKKIKESLNDTDVARLSESSKLVCEFPSPATPLEINNKSICVLPSFNSNVTDAIEIGSSSINSTLNNTNEDNQEDHPSNLKNDLAVWAIADNVPQSTITNLLKVLKKYPCGSDLPLDARALLQTPRCVRVENMSNGVYHHFGIEEGIKFILSKINSKNLLDPDLKLLVNVDGLPLAKSSGSQLWPILGSLSYNLNAPCVFPIGIFHSNQKPENPNLFLNKFVEEMNKLIKNGIVDNGKHYKIDLKGMICNAPARAFILCIKGHSGYSSCNKCFQEGLYFKKRVCFPEVDFVERTDSDFRNRLAGDSHHKCDSELLKIDKFGPVSQVPFEYMHLVCLGVMKKLIKLWLKCDIKYRLSNSQSDAISVKLLSFTSSISNDFVRRPRALRDFERWKATEYRQFLLFTGPIVLKGSLRNDLYMHFLLLHCSIKVFITNSNIAMMNFAHSWLLCFVKGFPFLYGKEHMSHNIHCLLHLSKDVKNFGPLDQFSSFQFENYMKEFKNMIRKAEKPLQQVIKRFEEKKICFVNNQVTKELSNYLT